MRAFHGNWILSRSFRGLSKKEVNEMKRFAMILWSVALVGLFIVLQGCVTLSYRNFGRFSPDRGATEAFERYQVNPGMNYYMSGSDVHPNALLGLDKRYMLESTLWKRVEMTPDRLKELVTGMKARTSMVGQSLHGFVLLDPQGDVLGIWYSILSATTAFHMKEDNRVIIYTPDLNTYDKFEDKEWGLGL